MGTPKAALDWRGGTLLHRTVSVLADATGGPVVVVRAAGQPLPRLPDGTIVIEDPREGKGPLQGIAAGLAALGQLDGRQFDGRQFDGRQFDGRQFDGRQFDGDPFDGDPFGSGPFGSGPFDGAPLEGGPLDSGPVAAFVAATDMPFLHQAFVRRVLALLTEDHADVALPVARGHVQPLAAAYRVALAPLADQLVASGRLRPADLFASCTVTRLDEGRLLADASLAAADPGLDSLINVNDPAEYAAALARLDKTGTGKNGPERT
jgi:molybdopterin-guanine dinucleotide biosynthesis protein A